MEAARRMTDFTDFPKQWLVTRAPQADVVAGHAHRFAGWHIQAAAHVPVLPIAAADGRPLGRLIGWALRGAHFFRRGDTILLAAGETVADLYRQLGGRFVLMWTQPNGDLQVREDASGGLPLVYSAAHQAFGSTISVLEQVADLTPDRDVQGIFDFPTNRGFLPFGLTARVGVRRLMPHHVLNTQDFSAARVWPDKSYCGTPRVNAAAVADVVAEIAQIVEDNLYAVLTRAPATLHMSGGHDCRIILAAILRLPAELRAKVTLETLTSDDGLDSHIAGKVAALVDMPLRVIDVPPADGSAPVAGWLRRTGEATYDYLAHASETIVANQTVDHALTGTGAELARGSNYAPEDLDAAALSLDVLLTRTRLPDVPVVRTAAAAWLAGLPDGIDAIMALDLCKIEQIHGCWAGAAIYGHWLDRPGIMPFSGHRITELVLSLPKDYRANNQFYRDFLMLCAPELAAIPANKAVGLERLLFWRSTAKAVMPTALKRLVKPLR